MKYKIHLIAKKLFTFSKKGVKINMLHKLNTIKIRISLYFWDIHNLKTIIITEIGINAIPLNDYGYILIAF